MHDVERLWLPYRPTLIVLSIHLVREREDLDQWQSTAGA
jgi:hypothetical protein